MIIRSRKADDSGFEKKMKADGSVGGFYFLFTSTSTLNHHCLKGKDA